MNIVLNSPRVPTVNQVIEYPTDLATDHVLVERDRELVKGNIRGNVHEIIFDGICIELRNVYLPEALEMNVEHDFPFLKMHFELTGHSSYRPESTNAHSLAVDIPNGHHQLFYFPRVKGSLYYPPSPKRTTLEITISHHFLKRMFHREWEIMKQLGAAIDGNEPLIVGTTSKKISPQLHVVIQQIVNCKIEGIMKRPYLAAKVMELFILQLQELTESSFLAKPSTVSELELRALSEAKDYIHQNLNSNCTIAHIAKAVGLNTLKLKTGFKQIYGDTVFEYLTKARMQEAVRLLMNTNLQIGEVANSVGYKHSQHFAKAFKKQFGVLPNGFDRRSSFSVKN